MGLILPGLVIAAAIASCATVAGGLVPTIGAPVFAIVIGLCAAPWLSRHRRDKVAPGLTFAGRAVLQWSVVLLGAQLSLAEVVGIGGSSLPVMLGTLAACFLAAGLLGRWMRVEGELCTLIAVGTGICGASAIAAVTSVIKPRHRNVAYAISTIFVFNIAAVLLFPPLGRALELDQEQFGVFAGTAVNDTSSVIAAAAAYGQQASDHAVVVKLARSLMIIPICLALGALARGVTHREDGSSGLRRTARLVPWFLVGFLILACVGSVGLIPPSAASVLQHITVFLITVAMAGIGCSVDLNGLRRAGARPLALGALLWLIVSFTSLALQFIL